MRPFELFIGNTRRYIAAADHEDAYKQGTDPARHPDICYLPFEVTEIKVPGYEIYLVEPGKEPAEHDLLEYGPVAEPTGEPSAELPSDPLADTDDGIPTDREELKAWLTERGIDFNHRLGEAKLLELAQAWQPPADDHDNPPTSE